jgi:predicted nucleic acid-binding protein
LKSYLVDASVGAKWCLPAADEPYVQEAEDLLESFKLSQVRLFVPDLFWTEVANALWKSVRRKKLSLDRAIESFSILREAGIATLPTASLLPEALNIAALCDRTVYDSVYMVLAVQSSTEMVTADERLARALAAYLPVKWLGVM